MPPWRLQCVQRRLMSKSSSSHEMLDAFVSLPPYVSLTDLARRFKVSPKDLAREQGSGISFSNRKIIQRDQVCFSPSGAACSPIMGIAGQGVRPREAESSGAFV